MYGLGPPYGLGNRVMLLDAVFSCCWFGSMKGEATRETFPGVLGRELGFEMLD